MLHCGHSYHDICIGDTKCKKCHSFLANRIEERTEAFNEGLLNDDDKDANRWMANDKYPGATDLTVAPGYFCFMKNSNTHACIVSALSP